MSPLLRAWHAHCNLLLEMEGISFDRTQEALAYLGFPADACPGDLLVQLWAERDALLRDRAALEQRLREQEDETKERLFLVSGHAACRSEDPLALRDCQGDGHYSCKTCTRRIPRI